MIVEVQIDVGAFCRSFREQMRKALACELTEDVLDLDPSDGSPGTRYVVTGYTVGETKMRRARTQATVCVHAGAPNVVTHRAVNRPQILQQLVVHVAWEHELVAANAAKAPTVPITLPLVFELGMETCGDMRRMCINYVGLDASVDQALGQRLGQRIRSVCTFLPIDRVIGSYLPPGVALVNSHLTMTDSGSCLAVRMELWSEEWGSSTGDHPRPLVEWDRFYAGQVVDRLQRGAERDGWGIFVDSRALTHFVRQTVLKGVAGSADRTITRQPVASWHDTQPWPFTGVPVNRVHVDLEVKEKDACWCVTEDIDVTAEIAADVIISVPAEDVLRVDVDVDISPDFWDASCCVLTASLFWPVLGLGQTVKGNLDAGLYWLGFLPLVALIGSILKIDEASSSFPPPDDFVQDPDDETRAWRATRLDLPDDPNFGKMSLRGSRPLTDTVTLGAQGLYLYGGLDVRSAPQPVLRDPDLAPFCWSSGGRCSRRVAASSRFRLEPENPQHWALLQVCDVRVINDHLGVFHVEVRREPHGLPDVVVSVDFWAMNRKYWQQPYQCQLMVKTTGGVRIVTLPPLPALTEEQFQALYLGIQLEFVNECYLPRQRLFEELEWPIEVLIDEPGLHHWQVRAVGLDPEARFLLLDAAGQEVDRFTANAAGTLLVDAVGTIEAAGAPPTFTLRREGLGRTRGLRSLLARSRLRSDAAQPMVVSGLDVSTRPICGPDGRGTTIVMDRIRDMHFPDLVAEHLDPDRRVIVRQTVLEEAGRVRVLGRCESVAIDHREGWARLVTVTSGLVEAYDVVDPHRPSRAGAWRGTGIRGAVAFGGRLVLWGDHGIWPAGDVPPTAVPFRPACAAAVRSAVIVGDHLAVLQGDQLRVFAPDLSEIAARDCEARRLAARGDRLALVHTDGVRVVSPLEDGSSEELHLTASDVLAADSGDARSAGVVRAGRLLAILDGNDIQLLVATRTVQSE